MKRMFRGRKASWLLALCMIFLIYDLSLAQVSKVPPAQLVLKDTINFGDSARSGLVNKIIQPIRFHENRIKKERERMVVLIRKLAKEGDMSIDSTTVDAIVDDMVALTAALASTRDTTVRLQDEINQVVRNLGTKAPKLLVDSIQMQLGNVLQGLLDDSKAENIAARNALVAKLAALRKIQFSCGSEGLAVMQDTLGDTLQVNYQFCLNAQTRIFGWHLATMKDRFQNYNFNYLTDLVLYGYELGANGRESNPKSLLGMLDGGILEKNKSYGKAVSLAIHSNSASIVSNFLNENTAQQAFIVRMKELMKGYNLNGLNIYFEEIRGSDSDKFSSFIQRLKAELGSEQKDFFITLSIPPIANTKSSALANAYNFSVLNALVDFYLVQTQNLNITGTRIAFAPSPLYPDPVKSRGSIEETFDFYLNGRIPAGKLVMTVGYQGITWPMPDFVPGSRATGFGSMMDYRTIQKSLVTTVDKPDGAVLGYDPEQVSAYLNYGGLGNLKQVWFEDSKSLVEKYTWAMDNATGGVAIWGLGDDDGYTDLWDALGATLIRIDSVVISSKIVTPKDSTSLSIRDYLWTYLQDIQWAGLNDIYIGNPNQEDVVYCYFEIYPDLDSLKRLEKAYHVEDFWQKRNEFVPYDTTDYYSVSSMQDCVCMIGRWNRYAEVNAILAVSLLSVMLVGVVIVLLGIRKHGDEWTLRNLFTGISIVLGLLGLVALFFALFFNTDVGFIGAGSSEVTIWVLILIFAFGIVAGLVINRLRMAKKFAYRDLP